MMLKLNDEIFKEARRSGVEISIFELLDYRNAVTVRLTDQIPKWVIDELGNEGLCIEKSQHGRWILEPVDQ